MSLTQIETTASKVECTSTSSPSTSSQPSKGSLYDQLFDGLSRLGYGPGEVDIVLGLFQDLATEVHTGGTELFDFYDGVYRLDMDMDGHDLLDAVMIDKAVAADGSLHELANKVFLPAGKTFIHDVTDFCVLEVRDEEEDVA